MIMPDLWHELHHKRFSELPFDCGNVTNPGVRYCEHLRDWSAKATTPDQRRIEYYIDRYDLREKRILHVGIGNSSLATRFHNRVKHIVGTTIDEPEIGVARSLGLPNYGFALHNKFSGKADAVDGQFDFILDNNPTSPCCCMRHLADLFEFYGQKLARGGQIVTDKLGLQWVPEDSHPRWSFDFDDLAAVAGAAGLSAFRMSKTVYVLSRSAPPPPDLLSRSRYVLRRVRMAPGQIARNGPRFIRNFFRRGANRLAPHSSRPRMSETGPD